MPNLTNLKTFYDSDIAMMEHDIIADNDILEWSAENLQWYISGVHDFAKRMIDEIRGKDGGDQ